MLTKLLKLLISSFIFFGVIASAENVNIRVEFFTNSSDDRVYLRDAYFTVSTDKSSERPVSGDGAMMSGRVYDWRVRCDNVNWERLICSANYNLAPEQYYDIRAQLEQGDKGGYANYRVFVSFSTGRDKELSGKINMRKRINFRNDSSHQSETSLGGFFVKSRK